jgi:diaminopimelate epimerase
MDHTFYKYQGTGNDFIIFDNREGLINFSKTQIAQLCDRHFGIGADGLMLLQEEKGFHFRMVYYNSDGGESTMCGNGGRCMIAFAHKLGLIDTKADFIAIDGEHRSSILENGLISLQMNNVNKINIHSDHTILNTGSPHYVLWVNDVKDMDIFNNGRKIRNQPEFQPDGINVNFVEKTGTGLWVRTYERGVENETLSCGTGVTAAAIAETGEDTGTFATVVNTPGGVLQINFTKDTPLSAKDVLLCGPAQYVFEGRIAVGEQ